ELAAQSQFGLPGTSHSDAPVPTKPLYHDLARIARRTSGAENSMPDNNTVQRTIRPIALNRKNALFAGHDAGAENWAITASLIETCKMNAVDPHAWLARTPKANVSGHKQSQIDDLLPWNYAIKV
ncbi:MAG: transposase domain-containing protein, partial [Burkholderiaceae bacterium]|nr:transposase domain-containing protein [Burkholderiaceae bacterium]